MDANFLDPLFKENEDMLLAPPLEAFMPHAAPVLQDKGLEVIE